jgi:hypothetical protein
MCDTAIIPDMFQNILDQKYPQQIVVYCCCYGSFLRKCGALLNYKKGCSFRRLHFFVENYFLIPIPRSNM